MKLQMAQNNVGSLVVLKPGVQQYIAGIITERGKLYRTKYDQFVENWLQLEQFFESTMKYKLY